MPWLAVTMIGWLGWQFTFLALSLTVPLILLPLALYCIRHGFARADYGAVLHAAPAGMSAASTGARRALLGDYRFWLMLPGYMAGPFMVTGIFVHQNFVVASKGWTLSWFAICFVVYGFVHWISSLISGTLVDRFQAAKLLPYFPLPMALGLLALAYVPGTWVAVPAMALLAVSIGASPPISNSLWPEIYGSNNIGAIRSMTVAIMVFSTALSPILFGFLIDRGVTIGTLMGSSGLYVLVSCGLMTLSYPLNGSRQPV